MTRLIQICISLILSLHLSAVTALPSYPPGNSNSSAWASHVTSNIISGLRSPSRPFYVRLSLAQSREFFCGGSIVSVKWILTAAHCLDQLTEEQVAVEVGDFSLPDTPVRRFAVESWVVHGGYSVADEPQNDIALIKLRLEIPNNGHIIPLCVRTVRPGELLIAAGLGSTSTRGLVIPELLMETNFVEVSYQSRSLFSIVRCRPDHVCTLPVFDKGSICTLDSGGPLFRTICGTSIAECLYGVSSFSSSKEDVYNQNCNGGSFFAKVPHFMGWILSVISQRP